MINGYLSGMDVDADTHCTIQQYLKFIQRRAAGEIYTTAAWLREFVTKHPDYMYVFKYLLHFVLKLNNICTFYNCFLWKK